MATWTPSPNFLPGNTEMGSDLADSHQLTGSVTISGSLAVNGVPIGGGGGGISWDGSTANGVATYKDADEATVESNLTFDGTTLTVTGGIMQQQYFSASISSPVNATCSLYNVFNYHLTDDSEVTASSPVAGTSYLFFFRQDGTGAHTVDFSGFKWPGGTAPTLSIAGGAVDIVSGISDGTYIYADTTKNFS
jgi:hypothetical protein